MVADLPTGEEYTSSPGAASTTYFVDLREGVILMKEVLEYLENERVRGLKIHDEMDKLMMEGFASDDQEYDWSYYEGYADGMAAAINKLRG
jgi:hypothetical protein